MREPDEAEIAAFVRALFPYADEGSFLAIRAFLQHTDGVPPPYSVGVEINGAGLDPVIAAAVAGARYAANATDALVFAPPIATFKAARGAAEADLVNCICISVEIDAGDTGKARVRLEGLLGPATVAVASGGECIDDETGEVFAKVHLHWRLSEPTRTPEEHAALKHARRLACVLVGADPSAKTAVHPLRWPGSWHLKNAPKLARITALNQDAEVHLAEALEALETAAEQAGLRDVGSGDARPSGPAQAPLWKIQSALAALPNNDEHWDDWIKIGLLTYAATGASDAGLAAWIEWSRKSSKFVDGACEERWDHFHRSPPTRGGAGTLFFLAKAAGWVPPQPEEQPRPEAPPDPGAPTPEADAPLFDPWAELQPPSFPIDALPPVLRAFAEDRSRVMGADPGAIAWAAISAVSAALDGSVRLQMKRHDRWTVPPAIWVALIGASSTMKSPVIEAAWEPLMHAQKHDLDDWRQRLAAWKATPKSERDPEEPKPRRRLVSHDGTMEALQDILSRQDRGIGVLRDELSGWLGQLEKYSGAKASGADRAFFLQAYNGGSNVIDRVTRGTLAVNNLLVTICGGIQPERLRQFSDLADDGLWQRFVPIILRPALLGTDEQPGNAVMAYAEAINRILSVPGSVRVELCHAAHDMRAEIERKVFDLQQSDLLGARFASFCGKLVGLWGRLCLVLNYLDPDNCDFIVPLMTAERAAKLLFQSVIPSAARVYAATGGAGADPEATKSVAGYILTKQKARVLASDLAHNVRACRGQPLEDVQRIVSPLVAGGWMTPEKEWNPFSWATNPAVHSRFQARAQAEAARRAALRDVLTGRLGANTQ